ncbi:MAG TPA: hypothetical protein VM865_10760 [Acidobacteriaceae bacterium]|nr:hypothetical protein [Acidobacteriaceae bacterium]
MELLQKERALVDVCSCCLGAEPMEAQLAVEGVRVKDKMTVSGF